MLDMNTLSGCKAAGIPVYDFGSAELDALHAENRDPPYRVATRGEGWYLGGHGEWRARRAYPVYMQVYAARAEGLRYVVDHGGFYTLNTLHAGQVVPASRDIRAD